jgi:hypothetical protein
MHIATLAWGGGAISNVTAGLSTSPTLHRVALFAIAPAAVSNPGAGFLAIL